MKFREETWVPKTKLGKMVQEGQITSLEEVFASGLPLKEALIIDTLLPELVDDVLDINMVQRMTDSGRRVKFRATVVVGNNNGYVGVGCGKDVQVGSAIKKAISDAKLNLIPVKRGCGSWECGCQQPHSVPFEVKGKAGSATVTLKPAPQGLGIAAGETAKKVLTLAGIKDVWTETSGKTRTTLNFAKATYEALKQTAIMRR
ncbi:MAG: 30S ribosomal protein S5 [Methanosarcinales archaeon]|nr:MAG: 30S ribosomal protein S5 [Methanosarcinales archaeon]